MNMLADTIVRPGHTALGYAEKLLVGVTPDIFARKPRVEMPAGAAPRVLEINHPAFCLGHLAIYPQRLLQMCGADATPAEMPSNYAELFGAGKECQDDSEGTLYPPMNEITEHFFTAYRHVLESVAALPDEVLSGPNPAEGRMKEMFPTIAAASNFMIGAHIMMHLGQVSAWRRCFGLGPAM